MTIRICGALIATACIAAACSSSGGETTSSTSAPSNPQTTEEVGAPSEPSTSEFAAPVDENAAKVVALQSSEPEIVDPDGETRCDRLGYPCSWSDVPDDEFDRSYRLSVELNEITLGRDDAAGGLDAAVEHLTGVDDLVELIVDRETNTGLMYRLEGMPPMFAFTQDAGPVGDHEPLDLAALGVEPDLGSDADSAGTETTQPQGFAGGPLPKAYHPAGGPIVPKQAVVIDPYATQEAKCPDGAPEGTECLKTKKNRFEGSIVNAILGAPEQITSTYLPGNAADPIVGPPLSDFDLVHIVTHGSSACADLGPGYVVSFSQDDPKPLPDRCYSAFAIGTFQYAKYADIPDWRDQIPDGVSPSGTMWAATDDYLTANIKSDAIVYMSHCTGADGSFYRSGRYGSYVGWHSYARITTAEQAGITFWNLMATEGLEFEQAIEELDDRDLSTTTVLSEGGVVGAVLASGGKNQRARDVIEVEVGGEDPNGQVIQVTGIPGDEEIERLPAEGQEITFDVEGVRRGTEGSVELEVYLDDGKLDADLDLERDGSIIRPGEEWDTWRLTVPTDAIELWPTTAADFAPDRQFQLEVRAFEESDEYTADGGVVRLGAALESTGKLAIFTDLKNALEPTGAAVDGNDLRLAFNTEGGQVFGQIHVTVDAPGASGFWNAGLEGTYDPRTGEMSGTFDAVAAGFLAGAGLIASDDAPGQWSAVADLDARRVTGVLSASGQSQSYDGEIVVPG